MALLTCPDCAQKYSTGATACPSCGYRNRGPFEIVGDSLVTITKWVVVIGFLLYVAAVFTRVNP